MFAKYSEIIHKVKLIKYHGQGLTNLQIIIPVSAKVSGHPPGFNSTQLFDIQDHHPLPVPFLQSGCSPLSLQTLFLFPRPVLRSPSFEGLSFQKPKLCAFPPK